VCLLAVYVVGSYVLSLMLLSLYAAPILSAQERCSPIPSEQTAMITGIVRDSLSGEELSGVNIRAVSMKAEGASLGAISSKEGAFVLRRIATGEYRLQVRRFGYVERVLEITIKAGDSLHVEIVLMPEDTATEDVVVTGTRTARSIANVPVRVEAVPQEEIEEKMMMRASNVALMLSEQTGVRVQTTSPASNTANLRIQGLQGRYTQILVDGIPAFTGLGSSFGVMQLLPLNLRQVELIKGANSVLYGADAIAGVVNFITKNPNSATPELSALLNGTTQRGLDASAFWGQKFGEVGTTLLASYNTQAKFDVDGDGLSDIAGYNRFTLAPKFTVDIADNLKARISLGAMTENREGGVMNTTSVGLGETPYIETNTSHRLNASAELSWQIADKQTLTFKASGMNLRRDGKYGTTAFHASQTLAYGEMQYSENHGNHDFVVGASALIEDFADRTPPSAFNPMSRSYRFASAGLFAQEEFTLAEPLRLLASGRVDIHNIFGVFFTPRVSFIYHPTNQVTVRLGGGTGWKAPTIFIEEAEEIGFRGVRLPESLKAETAQHGTFDVNWKSVLLDEISLNFNAALFLTRLQHSIIAHPDSLQRSVVVLEQATGDVFSRGSELSVLLQYSNFKLSLGYAYTFATLSHRNLTEEIPLNPRHWFGAVLMYENEEVGWRVGLENYYTGAQRLERSPFRAASQPYWMTGLLVEKAFGITRLYVNFENIFDTRQTRFDPTFTGNPLNIARTPIRPLEIYAPLEGRVINGGVRVML
jgi:iron complex outermembrane receptor protein